MQSSDVEHRQQAMLTQEQSVTWLWGLHHQRLLRTDHQGGVGSARADLVPSEVLILTAFGATGCSNQFYHLYLESDLA